jgi:hypothetical protein
MMLGLSLTAFTQLHVVLSLAGIATGLVVMGAMIAGHMSPAWTGAFLATTLLTSVTGFLFPFDALLPSHVVGIISIVVLAAALVALYARGLAGPWRGTYVVATLVALYLNCFVAIVQAFLKLGVLHASGALQGIVQGIVFAAFVAFGYRAFRNFQPGLAASPLLAPGRKVHR